MSQRPHGVVPYTQTLRETAALSQPLLTGWHLAITCHGCLTASAFMLQGFMIQVNAAGGLTAEKGLHC